MEPTPQNHPNEPEIHASSAPQQAGSPRKVNYMAVFKNPVLLISIGVFVVLYIIGALQANEDLKVYLSIPLLAFTPVIVGILIIKEAKKK